jgi:hypothetical protein
VDTIMKSFKDYNSSSLARVATAVIAVLSCVVCLGSVLALFASASGELDPVLAKLRSAPSASAVATRSPLNPAPS